MQKKAEEKLKIINEAYEAISSALHRRRENSSIVQESPVQKEYAPINLVSSSGVNYSSLKKLLVSQQWLKADQETANLMLVACNCQINGWLRPEKDIIDFPCEDLAVVNQLWERYSNGKFDFSAQYRVWKACKLDKYAARDFKAHSEDTKKGWCRFGEEVGWRKNQLWKQKSELAFSLNAPKGSLPIIFIHWDYSVQRIGGFIPSSTAWDFTRWLASGLGTEGNSVLAAGGFWPAYLFSRFKACNLD